MRRIVLVLLLLFSFSLIAQEVPESDRPSREEIIKWFEVMKIADQVTNMQQAMSQQFEVAAEQQARSMGRQLSPEEQQKFRELMRWTMDRAVTQYPASEMLNDMIPVYQKYMSRADLAEITSFYSSPVGQRMLQRMPMMTKESMQVLMPKVQERMAKLIDEMQVKMKEIFPEQKALGEPQSTSPKQSSKPSKVPPKPATN